MTKVLVLATDGSEDIELVTSVDILRRASLTTVIAALDSNTKKITCALGLNIIPDASLDAIDPAEFDALLLPGGSKGAKTFTESPRVQQLIKQMHGAGKLVSAICAGPMALAKSGILRGRHATIYPGLEGVLDEGGAVVKHEQVVHDGNVVTGRGPGAAIPFALKVVQCLVSEAVCKKIAQDMLYFA
jgi:4-methyl-5(b-hydroxyethyl)-thiazole monophosphate biosynthesis